MQILYKNVRNVRFVLFTKASIVSLIKNNDICWFTYKIINTQSVFTMQFKSVTITVTNLF